MEALVKERTAVIWNIAAIFSQNQNTQVLTRKQSLSQ